MNEKWMTFRQWWERKEVLDSGPSKSEYFILILLYPLLYLFSGYLHELGHIVGAMLSGIPITKVIFTPTVFSVSINAFGKNPTLAKLSGGLFQGIFFLIISKRYRPLCFVTISCFVYAVAEAAGLSVLMIVCTIFSEIVGHLIVIYCADE